MKPTVLATVIAVLPSLCAAQPASAIQFYDTTGTDATVRLGWQGSRQEGKFYVETPPGNEAISMQNGNLRVAGELQAQRFVGDGSRLENVAEPATLQERLDAKSDTGHEHHIRAQRGTILTNGRNAFAAPK